MATRRRSSATTATRPVKKSPSKVTVTEKVTKYTTPVEIKKVTEETPKVHPGKPNLTWQDYRDDLKIRMQINNYECVKLYEDMRDGVKFLLPYGKQAMDYVMETYQQISAQFNQEEVKEG